MKWYLETGPEGDVVISTRIRLARNIADFPFPCKMTTEQARTVIDKASAALLDRPAGGGRFELIEMQKLTPARAMSFVEKHLVSPEFAQQREGRALLLSDDETISVMLIEEDHIRIQSMLSGMRLKEALDAAFGVDDRLDEKLPYAFDESLGYLTQCPTNLGTGLRASLMLHLPCITQSGALTSLGNTLSKLGLTIRGTYGEGTEAKGAFYQISNQVTLGISETEAIENLQSVANQIIQQERAAREAFRQYCPQIEDRIFRSYGILRSARLMSAEEFMTLISEVRLGVTMGILDTTTLETVNTLIYETQPASLIANAGRNLDAQGRDLLRAQLVREKLN